MQRIRCRSRSRTVIMSRNLTEPCNRFPLLILCHEYGTQQIAVPDLRSEPQTLNLQELERIAAANQSDVQKVC